MAGLYTLWLAVHFTIPPKPVFSVGYQMSVQSVLLWWTTCCVFLQVTYDRGRVPDNLSLFYGAVGCLCLSFLAYLLERRRILWFLSDSKLQVVTEKAYVETVYCLSILIERSGDKFYRKQLQVVLRNYSLIRRSQGTEENPLVTRFLCPKSSLASHSRFSCRPEVHIEPDPDRYRRLEQKEVPRLFLLQSAGSLHPPPQAQPKVESHIRAAANLFST
jgi:hypothetical protein